jgi:hypothetical protein
MSASADEEPGMATDTSHRPFLDQALEAYRAGAKAWSRDGLLSGLVLLFAGVFVVQPFLDWSEQGRTVTGEREEVRRTQERVVAGERGIGGLLGALDEARAAAAATAETLAADLSHRLRRFADLARRLDEPLAPPAPEPTPTGGEPNSPAQWPQANFPGAAIAQQFALPPELRPELLAPPLLAEPADALREEFGLTAEDLEQFRRGFAEGAGSSAWQIASATSERVFRREIERSYGELERRVGARLAAVREDLADGLAELRSVTELGSTLPAPEQLLPQTTVVRLPSEDELFRTVAGKAEAFRGVGLYEVNLNLDAASAPLHRAAVLLTEASDRLEGQQAALEQQRVAIEGELRSLDDRLATIRGKLGGLGAPLQWLAIDTASFVLLYPTLIALAALWLAVRYRRLDDLGARLEAGYRELGIADRDVRLALYIPDAALGRLQDPTAGSGRIGRWLRPLLALALALGLGLLSLWILRAAGSPGWGWSAPPLLLGVLASWLMLRARPPRTDVLPPAPG